MEENKCITGCKHFHGGEILHHRHCPYYEESISQMYNDLKERSKWINVNDRLPEEYVNVLLYVPNDTPTVGYLGKDREFYAMYNNLYDYEEYVKIKWVEVTHWMPLPELPK